MEMTISTPVHFTEGAIKQVTRLMAKDDFDPSQLLRIGVKGGGCSGMTYIMEFDHQDKDDNLFEISGIRCIMNKAHEMYLYGMEIDWQEGLNNRGFTFKNPNASTTCGCGTSFGV
jgi:iron-sulfur cluster assembly protein